jgi:hypothetical protein
MTQKHAPQIIEALTSQVLRDELNMTDRAIRHAKTSGTFAAFWYRPLKELCESHGIFCPLDAFNWKDAAKNNGTSGASNKPAPMKQTVSIGGRK